EIEIRRDTGVHSGQFGSGAPDSETDHTGQHGHTFLVLEHERSTGVALTRILASFFESGANHGLAVDFDPWAIHRSAIADRNHRDADLHQDRADLAAFFRCSPTGHDSFAGE